MNCCFFNALIILFLTSHFCVLTNLLQRSSKVCSQIRATGLRQFAYSPLVRLQKGAKVIDGDECLRMHQTLCSKSLSVKSKVEDFRVLSKTSKVKKNPPTEKLWVFLRLFILWCCQWVTHTWILHRNSRGGLCHQEIKCSIFKSWICGDFDGRGGIIPPMLLCSHLMDHCQWEARL